MSDATLLIIEADSAICIMVSVDDIIALEAIEAEDTY